MRRPPSRWRRCGPRDATCSNCLLLKRELIDVDVTDSEALGATSEVVHVAAVNLLRLHGDGLVLVRLQRLRPAVERPGIVQLQGLAAGEFEAGLCRVLLDLLDARYAAAREDLGEDELNEPGHVESQRNATIGHLRERQTRDGV